MTDNEALRVAVDCMREDAKVIATGNRSGAEILAEAAAIIEPHALPIDEIPKYDGAVLIISRSKSLTPYWALYNGKDDNFISFISRNSSPWGFKMRIDRYRKTWSAWNRRPDDGQVLWYDY